MTTKDKYVNFAESMVATGARHSTIRISSTMTTAQFISTYVLKVLIRWRVIYFVRSAGYFAERHLQNRID